MQSSGCCYHLTGVCAGMGGRSRACVLVIWLARVQRQAGALEHVFLSFGTRDSERERAQSSGRSSAVLTFGSRCERVRLSFGRRLCSAKQVRLSMFFFIWRT